MNIASHYKFLFFLTIAIGTFLRLLQFLSFPSFWLDEVALARGIIETPILSLLSNQLPYGQIAPKGFIVAIKMLTDILGESDWVFRLIPLLSSLLSLLLFFHISRSILSPLWTIMSLIAFSSCAPMILFSSIAKQYSSDICVTLIFLCVGHQLIKNQLQTRLCLIYSILGALAVWFSQPAVFTIFSVALSLLVHTKIDSKQFRLIFCMSSCWGISALTSIITTLRSTDPELMRYMKDYWQQGFPPSPLYPTWIIEVAKNLFASNSIATPEYLHPMILVILVPMGFIIKLYKNTPFGTILSLTVCSTFIASLFRLYPFYGRPVLFLMPIWLLMALVAIENCTNILNKLYSHADKIFFSLSACYFIYPITLASPPYSIENIKPVMEYLQTHKQSSDSIYVYYGAAPAFTFYANNYNIPRTAYKIGGCHRDTALNYIDELNFFTGTDRAWIVITHAIPSLKEREFLLSYLNSIGSLIDSFSIDSHTLGNKPPAAELFLFDLTKTTNSQQIDFPNINFMKNKNSITCGKGPETMIKSDFEKHNVHKHPY